MCGRAAGGGGREVGGSAQPKTRTPQKDVGKNSCNTEVLYSIILVGGFNPSEKYEFVGLDNHPSYWGDILTAFHFSFLDMSGPKEIDDSTLQFPKDILP